MVCALLSGWFAWVQIGGGGPGLWELESARRQRGSGLCLLRTGRTTVGRSCGLWRGSCAPKLPERDCRSRPSLRTTNGRCDDGLGTQQCVRLIVELVGLKIQTTIVIDALDGCSNDTRHDLFRALRTIVQSAAGLVTISLSSGNDDEIEVEVSGESNIAIDVTDSGGDVELHGRAEVEPCIEEMRDD